MAVGAVLVLAGRYLDFFGKEVNLFLLERLEGRKERLPKRVFTYQGDQDSAVPVEVSRRLLRLWSERGRRPR